VSTPSRAPHWEVFFAHITTLFGIHLLALSRLILLTDLWVGEDDVDALEAGLVVGQLKDRQPRLRELLGVGRAVPPVKN